MLIDTHILIWVYEGIAGAMGPQAQRLMKRNFGECIVSSASFLEIKLKQRRGGLKQFDDEFIANDLINEQMIQILDVGMQHAKNIPSVQMFKHSDPFDLIFVAQAISERIPLLTCDEEILKISHPDLRLVDARK